MHISSGSSKIKNGNQTYSLSCKKNFQTQMKVKETNTNIRQKIQIGIKFTLLTGGIYTCFLISAVYHQKILKHPYSNQHTQQLFNQPLAFSFFPQLISTIIGYFLTLTESEYAIVPFKKYLVVGLLINFTLFTYNQAVIYASFPAIVMAKSCSLLSVILVGVFCSRVKQKSLKLGKDKIVVGILACIGIFVFNYFSAVNQNSQDHPMSYFSLLILGASLIGDGFLPDFQAEIKSNYKPSAYNMYYNVNKCVCLVSFSLLLLTFRIKYIFQFSKQYPQFMKDMLILSCLHSVGQIFIYQMIKGFQQHIPPFVIAVRKCFTVLVNLIWFNHLVNYYQIIGLFFVFFAVMGQVYTNNCKRQQACNENKDPEEKQPLQKTKQQIQLELSQYSKFAQNQVLSPPK